MLESMAGLFAFAIAWNLLVLLLLLFAGPQDANALLQSGLIAMQKGQTAEAQRILEKASQADTKNPYVWSSLAEVYLRLHEKQKSASAAEQAEQLGAGNPLVCHALAMYYSESDQPGRAAPLEQKFAESKQADSAATGRAASLFLAAGATDQAYALATIAVQKDASPFNESVIGRVLLAKGQPNDAVSYLRRAWEANPGDEATTFAYANVLLRLQSFTEAADTVEAAIKQHGPAVQLELLLGVARYGQRRFDDAVTTFLETIRLDPTVEQPYLFLGRLLEQAGPHLPEIVNADGAWAARDPKNPKAQLELAKALLQQDHTNARAGDLLKAAIALDPNDWESHYQLALVLEGKREFPAAADELQKSILLDAKQPMPHYHLARVYDRLGQADKADAERAIHTQMTAPTKERAQ